MLIIVEFLKEKGEDLKGKNFEVAIKTKSSINHIIAATNRRPKSAHPKSKPDNRRGSTLGNT